ncbi:MAG: reverse transcriptase-like protein [Terriglobia bacterium]
MKSFIAYIDGGSRGNPGVAGYGVFLLDENRNPLAEISEPIGIQTNNHAEYLALIGALRYTHSQQGEALQVYADSELLVRQINGQYKVRNPKLKELYDQAQVLIRGLKRFTLQHIPREENREADRLANQAMDQASGSVTLASPSSQTVRAVFKSGCFCPLQPLNLPEGEEFQLTIGRLKASHSAEKSR